MTGPSIDENSLISRPMKTEKVTLRDLAKCVTVGIAALAALSFVTFDEAHAHVDGGEIVRVHTHGASDEPDQPTSRERLKKLQRAPGLGHRQRPILDRLQTERNIRQAMYDEEGTHEILLENTMRKAMVIKPEHAQIRTAVSPRLLREIINAYHGEPAVEVTDDPVLSPIERNFAYKLKTRYGIGIVGETATRTGLRTPTGVTLRDALIDLEVTQHKRNFRIGDRGNSFSKTSSRQVVRNEPAPISVNYKIRRNAPVQE